RPSTGSGAIRNPYVDGPRPARVGRSVNRIACDHMSGLLSRSHMTAAKLVSATRGPNITAMSERHRWIPRSVSRLGIDRSHHLLLLEQASGLSSGAMAPRR